MSTNKQDVFLAYKHEIPSGALSRRDTGAVYIFMKDSGAKENLLIFDESNQLRKSGYSFDEKDGSYFINIDGTVYEMLLPDKISDEDAFTLHIKGSDGQLIEFENYI